MGPGKLPHGRIPLQKWLPAWPFFVRGKKGRGRPFRLEEGDMGDSWRDLGVSS